MAVIVKRPVIIKNVVTPTFKLQLTAELESAIRQIEVWLEQEEFQSRRMIAEAQKRGDVRRANQLREEVKREREKQEQVRSNLRQKLEQVKHLDLDSLFISGTYDSPVKIEVGDNIRAKLSPAEIIIKDGIVVQIIE